MHHAVEALALTVNGAEGCAPRRAADAHRHGSARRHRFDGWLSRLGVSDAVEFCPPMSYGDALSEPCACAGHVDRAVARAGHPSERLGCNRERGSHPGVRHGRTTRSSVTSTGCVHGRFPGETCARWRMRSDPSPDDRQRDGADETGQPRAGPRERSRAMARPAGGVDRSVVRGLAAPESRTASDVDRLGSGQRFVNLTSYLEARQRDPSRGPTRR